MLGETNWGGTGRGRPFDTLVSEAFKNIPPQTDWKRTVLRLWKYIPFENYNIDF
jgi:hypothetical protein